ncbi:TRASH domain-containing protein [Caldivirga maquilingensis]|uniref:Transcriptional regulator, TrmB n=1 Tax=Caldivirga maquilingensis (strain ATCC 700844 / DSM 13496 / JCM 10307 / IC-167) TaxID=397948 RepID=A8ME74_CALMQ|nr:TRASH domain-containing protein [Caldivirga maquilingensis]ABW02080.1 transcriptional regulator, TrmB [Caldivirga maquilingensis IC-167]
MINGSGFSRFNELELRALELLSEDSRLSVSELASRLGVSKATASRLIKSLRGKGVRFTVNITQGYPRAYVVARRRGEGECYRLVDGKYMIVLTAGDFNSLTKLISEVKGKEAVYIVLGQCSDTSELSTMPRLVCDYCGGPINGSPITYRRGRRVYYLCCKTCLRELKKRLSMRRHDAE